LVQRNLRTGAEYEGRHWTKCETAISIKNNVVEAKVVLRNWWNHKNKPKTEFSKRNFQNTTLKKKMLKKGILKTQNTK
jgi:hypothetical protein